MNVRQIALAAALPAALFVAAPAQAYYPFEARSLEGRGWSDPWVYGPAWNTPYARAHARRVVYPAYDVYSRDRRRGRLHNYQSSGVTWGSFACERDPFYRVDPRCLNR